MSKTMLINGKLRRTVDRCGISKHQDPEDSVTLAEKMAGMVGYTIQKTYDYKELDMLMKIPGQSGNMVWMLSIFNFVMYQFASA